MAASRTACVTYNQLCGLRPSVLGQDRSHTKNVLGIYEYLAFSGLGLAFTFDWFGLRHQKKILITRSICLGYMPPPLIGGA